MTWFVALAVTLAIALTPHVAGAQSGMQVTPDSKRTLINKDVADERWAITHNADGSVTGNVFFPGGGPPKFVSCQELAHTGGDVTLTCSGADACVLAPCDAGEWAFIAQVTLPETFFGLAPVVPFLSVDPSAPLGAAPHTVTAGAGIAGDVARGLQLTPEGTRTLINKDIGGERWTITRNGDGTVTGNVFLSGGGTPKFVWCSEKSGAADVVDLACFGADACVLGACRSADWRFIATVSLPRSFFAASDQVAMDAVVAAVTGALGEDGGFDAVARALDKGYSLRQVARAGLTGRLRSSGDIVDHAGALEPPAGPALGLFDTANLSALRSTPGATLDEMREEFRGKAGEFGLGMLFLLTELVQEGYPVDQIVEHLALGGGLGFVDPPPPFPPPFGLPFPDPPLSLLDEHGERVPPEKASDGAVAPPPHTQPSPTPVPTPTPPASICGNGDVESGEQCDGLDLDGWTCEAMGFNQGTLRCTAGCGLDTRECSWIPPDNCGNGLIDAHEDCDGANLQGFTCAEIFAGLDVGGPLGCKADCTFDTSGCQSCPGEIECEGLCAPIGADCCEGLGGWCAPGSVCTGTNTCCPADRPQFCGAVCVPPDRVCCPDGGACPANSVCAGGGHCCPAGFPIYCASVSGCIDFGPCP
ncbi:MAG: hypothetical protein HY271_04930 [Deltaproteobacteria bacterium]|nr:hypothetical protein [Deltaproteobacteria bacterium]